jgi:thiol-disulfide isomerase/thioredoxin
MQVMPDIIGGIWLNGEPPAGEEREGKATLLSFWTYSCIDCSLPLPYLRRWWKEYREKGLRILGIHTPEFEFEKDPAFMAAVIADLRIDWPIILDNKRTNWENFGIKRLPAMFLANRKKNIVYSHFGEGAYNKTEENIRLLLGEKAPRDLASPLDVGQRFSDQVCFQPTPQLHCGYRKGALGNAGGFVPDREADYVPPPRLEEDSIALSGRFISTPEYVETAGAGASIHVSFHATVVNLVALPSSGEAVASVAFNGEAPGEDLKGRSLSDAGELTIDRPLMYNLVEADDIVEGVLAVEVKRGSFRAYAFTFSGCVD